MGTRPVGDCFDNHLMGNIEEFISRYADETPLNVNDVVDNILNAPIDINEQWHHWNVLNQIKRDIGRILQI